MSGASVNTATGEVTPVGGAVRATPGGDAQALPSGQQSESVPRPAGLPDEFKSVEDMVAEFNKLKATKPGEQQQTQNTQQQQDGAQQQQQQAPGADDPRLAPYTEEVTKTGKLSDESRAKAAKEFLPGVDPKIAEAMVDRYVSSFASDAKQAETQTAQLAESFHKEFGGAEKYKAFSTWAESNIPQAELDAFNSLLDTNPTAALVMSRDFKSKWQAAGNSQPRDITNGGVSSEAATVKGYASLAEQKKDQGDPRYDKDPAFRKAVEQRIAVSKY